jgi:NADH-quinone oxidoreductase subunit L
MFALGVSGYGGIDGAGYSASLFHLFTHAFFKSLMFLGAGAIIHLVHSNDMADMGGLRKKMPVTHITFLIGCLAISGIPPFAGFFSKEEILHATWHHHPVIFYMAIATSALTAFYMFRLYFSIFWNKEKTSTQEHSTEHHGEGSWYMRLPLVILALCSIFAGFIPFSSFVSSDGIGLEQGVDLLFSIAPVALALGGILLAAYFYKQQSNRAEQFASNMGSFYTSAKNKFYIDEIYLFVTKKILFNLVGRPAAWIYKNIVDGFYYLTALITGEVSSGIRELQSGKIQSYALYFFGGIIWLALVVLYLMK